MKSASDYDFPPEAVRDVANAWETGADIDADNARESLGLVAEVGAVCRAYETDGPEESIELAMAGFDYFAERQKHQTKSDVRELFESFSFLWDQPFSDEGP